MDENQEEEEDQILDLDLFSDISLKSNWKQFVTLENGEIDKERLILVASSFLNNESSTDEELKAISDELQKQIDLSTKKIKEKAILFQKSKEKLFELKGNVENLRKKRFDLRQKYLQLSKENSTREVAKKNDTISTGEEYSIALEILNNNIEKLQQDIKFLESFVSGELDSTLN